MTSEEIRARLAPHRAELDRLGVRSLRVFGSVARGESGPQSDVDILVEFDREVSLFTLARLRLWLCDWLGREVDLGTTDTLRESMRGRVLAEALDAA